MRDVWCSCVLHAQLPRVPHRCKIPGMRGNGRFGRFFRSRPRGNLSIVRTQKLRLVFNQTPRQRKNSFLIQRTYFYQLSCSIPTFATGYQTGPKCNLEVLLHLSTLVTRLSLAAVQPKIRTLFGTAAVRMLFQRGMVSFLLELLLACHLEPHDLSSKQIQRFGNWVLY